MCAALTTLNLGVLDANLHIGLLVFLWEAFYVKFAGILSSWCIALTSDP